jgi:hypothetical protein
MTQSSHLIFWSLQSFMPEALSQSVLLQWQNSRLCGEPMDYYQWNKAIIEYFTAGLPSGSAVYLGVDDEALEEIGQRHGNSVSCGTWTEDFCGALRAFCVSNGSVILDRCCASRKDDLPGCVSFLAAMVLAASRMAENQTSQMMTAEHNYFTRLREVFGLSTFERGRPPGLQPHGIEKPLWLIWNHWLIERGFVPSAEPGCGGMVYIQYALSQSLLRQGDKQRLRGIFYEERRDGRLSRFCSANTLAAWFRNFPFRWSHISELAKEKDSRRFDAAISALLELFYSVDVTKPQGQPSSEQSQFQTCLMAGLYRVEDPITCAIEYLLYPRAPKGVAARDLQIQNGNQSELLKPDRPGWFQPLWAEPLAGGSEFLLHGDTRWVRLVLPEASFRILVRDPDDPTSGVFADWNDPGIEETFLFVCAKRYIEQLELLRDEKLLIWSDNPMPLAASNLGWYEFRECMILSPEWDGSLSIEEELVEALRPKVSGTISFSGGLRAPLLHRRGWMIGYPPVLRISAFRANAQLKITDLAHPDRLLRNQRVSTKEPLTLLHELPPGKYLLEALLGRRSIRQPLEIVDWSSLELTSFEPSALVNVIGGCVVRGALIEEGAVASTSNE